MAKIGAMARFGENLRNVRKALRLNQKELGALVLTEDGNPVGNAQISKWEAQDWAPRPETVQRIAEGVASVSKRSVKAEYDGLIDGVSSRFDAVQAQRANQYDQYDLRDLAAQLPPDKLSHFDEEFQRLRTAIVKFTKPKKGA